ncbi:MAG: Uma2 family endonuclease [Nitrososphaerales archaeon]
MSSMVSSPTWDELQAMEPDGRRYESLGGVLTVTPSPNGAHQDAVARLLRVLADAAPPDMKVLPAPYDWVVDPTEWYQPDVVVLRLANFDPRGPLRTAPVLAVEVISPSTRLYDLNVKRARYAENGCPSYWVIDPDEPSVLALELDGEKYQEAGQATGEDLFEADRPFTVTFAPAALIDE